jgi:four helix bundle protein
MTAYVLADKLVEDAWPDMEKVRDNPITTEIVGQMYESIGSIPANISEGYSRSSGKARALSFEYAVGSTRETIDWYHAVKPVLGEELVKERTNVLGDIRRLLTAIIPRERTRTISPKKANVQTAQVHRPPRS